MTWAHFHAIHERLMCLFIICETMFTIGDSRATSHANDTEQKAQQVAANPCLGRFAPKLLWRTLIKIHRREDQRTQPLRRENIT